jgi:hypothetical protein
MKIMRRAFALALVSMVFASAAHAQEEWQAYAAYDAAIQMQAENARPDWPAGAQHALLIMAAHGLDPGFDPGSLNASENPEGPFCIWLQQEDGSWLMRCSENYSFGTRCYTAGQIRSMEMLRDGAFWGYQVYSWGAIYFGATGQLHAAALLGGVALLFESGGWAIDRQLSQHLANKCPGNENDPQ